MIGTTLTNIDTLFQMNNSNGSISQYFTVNNSASYDRYYPEGSYSDKNNFSDYWKGSTSTLFSEPNGVGDIVNKYGKTNFFSEVEITMHSRDNNGSQDAQTQAYIKANIYNGVRLIVYRTENGYDRGTAPFIIWDGNTSPNGSGDWDGHANNITNNVHNNREHGHKYIMAAIGTNGARGRGTQYLAINIRRDRFTHTDDGSRSGNGGLCGGSAGIAPNRLDPSETNLFGGNVYPGQQGSAGGLEVPYDNTWSPWWERYWTGSHHDWRRPVGARDQYGGAGGNSNHVVGNGPRISNPSGGGYGGQRQRTRDDMGYNHFDDEDYYFSGSGGMYYGSNWEPYSEGDRYMIYGGHGGNGYYGGGSGGSGVQGGRGDDDAEGGGGGGGSSFVMSGLQSTGTVPIAGDGSSGVITGTVENVGIDLQHDNHNKIWLKCNGTEKILDHHSHHRATVWSIIITSDGSDDFGEI